MTTEEAIADIKNNIKPVVGGISLDMAIKALEQQPCEDAISREAVDEYITNLLSGYLYDEERTRLEDLTAFVWELPSVIPKAEQMWIPCTERFPDKEGCYLVSTTGTNNDIIDIAYYDEGIWYKASRIKAWMPLPEPYNPES